MIWSHPAFEDLARRVGAKTGLTFEAGRRGGAEAGVLRAMARAGCSDYGRYARRIEADPDAMNDLIAELTVGETYFFREPAHFEFLRRTALPELRRDRGEGVGLRAWSAACASGEEAYSLAIVLSQADPSGRGRVLATDISRTALAKAREARYGPWSLRGEGADAARPYLRPAGGRFEVVEPIRRSVTVAPLNLASTHYPSDANGTRGLDLIFCRNVLIYLDRATIGAVVRRLYEALAVGGWLVVASSDPSLSGLAPLEVVAAEGGIFYRRAGVAATARPAATAAMLARFATEPPPVANLLPLGPPADPTEAGPEMRPTEARTAPANLDQRGLALQEAREDFRQGRYRQVVVRTRPLLGDEEADMLQVRALANLDAAEAARACAEMARRHPVSAELHQLWSVLLLAQGQDEAAAVAARRVIYVDRNLAIAHFTLGTILRRQGDLPGARRAFRNARELCAGRPPDEVVPFSDGERAGHLAETSGAQLARLGPAPGGAS